MNKRMLYKGPIDQNAESDKKTQSESLRLQSNNVSRAFGKLHRKLVQKLLKANGMQNTMCGKLRPQGRCVRHRSSEIFTRQQHGSDLQSSSNMRICRPTGMNPQCEWSTAGHIWPQLVPPVANQVVIVRPWHQSCLPRIPNQ